jgi:hypothetical protein
LKNNILYKRYPKKSFFSPQISLRKSKINTFLTIYDFLFYQDHNNQHDKSLNEIFTKKMQLGDLISMNDDENTNMLLLNDLDTDNDNEELFASFSSCSSRFGRLGSISSNNSPILFMNERTSHFGGGGGLENSNRVNSNHGGLNNAAAAAAALTAPPSAMHSGMNTPALTPPPQQSPLASLLPPPSPLALPVILTSTMSATTSATSVTSNAAEPVRIVVSDVIAASDSISEIAASKNMPPPALPPATAAQTLLTTATNNAGGEGSLLLLLSSASTNSLPASISSVEVSEAKSEKTSGSIEGEVDSKVGVSSLNTVGQGSGGESDQKSTSSSESLILNNPKPAESAFSQAQEKNVSTEKLKILK